MRFMSWFIKPNNIYINVKYKDFIFTLSFQAIVSTADFIKIKIKWHVPKFVLIFSHRAKKFKIHGPKQADKQ